MDKVEKLFRKITKKDRSILSETLLTLKSGKFNNFDIKKVTGSNYYRLRIKRYRIIFHYENGRFKLDDIRLKNEKTYKNL